MGDAPLTKEELDRTAAEFAVWRKEICPPPVDAPKPATRTHGVKAHDATLIKAIMSAVAPLIHELQTRIAELESSTLKYCGVYQPSASYQRGNVVTYDGSAFHATRAVSAERPGASDGWQLMIKHGKDAPTPTPRGDATATAATRVNGAHPNPRMR
jgi:hypothetical protein